MGRVYDLDDRRRSRTTAEQLITLVDEIATIARDLRADLPDLVRRARGDSAPGFRSSTRFDGGGSGRLLTGDGHSDPLGEIVASNVDAERSGVDPDPVRTARRKATKAVLIAVQALREAEGAVLTVRPPHRAETDGCVVHNRYGFFAVTRRTQGSECRWCEDFRRDNQREPNAAEIAALEDVRHARAMRRAA